MIQAISPAESLFSEILPAFRPRDSVPSWEWICDNGRMPDGTPFNGDIIPWAKGVCDAWDDPETREVVLQWGTRLGKTTMGLQLIGKCAAVQPRPGLFATSTQALAERTVRNKIYPVLDNIELTRKQLPQPRWRTTREVRLASSPWYVAWSGSDTQLADLSAFYGVANEVDKWAMSEKLGGDAGEGDTLDQFLERFKEFHNAKILIECSPSTKRKSRIEKRRLMGNDCTYMVPCPKCHQFQELRLGKEDSPGGIRFDREPSGESNADLARNSARYVCEHCQYEIYDDQRPQMMRSGVWCPAGCYVDKRGRLKGTPVRSPRIWSSRLPSLYSLQLRWGDIASQFLHAKSGQQHLRMFVNGWLAETWEPHRSKTTPEKVGERLSTDDKRGVIPGWATWLFAAVDRQVDHFVYLVVACGPGERVHIVEHGTCETEEELETHVIKKEFPHADGGGALSPAVTFIDCGFKTRDIYTFCQTFRGSKHKVLPCKGASTDCAGEAYESKIIGISEGKTIRTKKALVRAGRGLVRVRVSPYYYEPIIQEQLDTLSPGEDCALSMHAECRDDLDLLKQLCNGAESAEPSKLDPDRHIWVKRWDNEANDYRDCLKYVRCAMDHHFKSGWEKANERQGSPKAPQRTVVAEQSESTSMRDRKRFRPEKGFRRR